MSVTKYGEYDWDYWKAHAIMKGVPEDLASLGRAVMREAYQHMWTDRLKAECGWDDDGVAMIALALKNPELARRRWGRLLETDGGLP